MGKIDRKQHECTVPGCNAVFTRLWRLETHKRKHNGDRPFVCEEEGCDKTYTNQSHLRRHIIKTHTKTASEVHICPHEGCSRELSSSTNLTKHINRAHNPNRVYPHVCDVCKKGFHKKTQLKSHTYLHTGEAPFKCEYCDLAFITTVQYKKHKNNHKPYTCNCEETFFKWTELMKHKRLCHSNFKCTTCNKSFVSKRNYKVHLTTHSELREVFECPMENCERLYYYKKNLQYHINAYHLKIKKNKKPVQSDEPPSKKRKIERKKQAIRKDKGKAKKSTALKLSGLSVPLEAEKSIIAEEPIDLCISSSDIDKESDFSDVELRIRITKTKYQNDLSTSEDDIKEDKNKKVFGA